MLKELNRLWEQALRRRAAWQRWYRKRPHNRVRRPRLRDERGRPIGYGPAVPVPEPELPAYFCEKVALPSGRWEARLAHGDVAAAYRLARHPQPAPELVPPLPLAEEEIRRRYEELCCR
jgi:hypothetical protein